MDTLTSAAALADVMADNATLLRALLMLDEPLEGLAPVICEMLMGVFERLAADGRTTIILVEQHAEMAVAFADRVVILDTGKIAYQGSRAEVQADPAILDRFVGVGLSAA
ncbi:high-affinity branched-chain amino acid transport ATP-binding protein LivF [mine drainage metagenome]|uniref:High-affinity branched-chain amino acid transport ATP-binding protein LivF n=1 Tax=mine drainage metagenome TaxID=410659 RepID=A0A1J5PPY4_9ZZZZ